MSTAMSTAMPTIVLTEKFEKELKKCLNWLTETGYLLKDIVDGSIVEWNSNLLNQFVEPGRNKLESYIKEVVKNFIIEFEGEIVDDHKMIVKNFKNRVDIKNEKVSNKKEEKSKKEVKSKIVEVVLDNSIDTLGTYYLDTLVYSTDELISVFGQPEKTGTESCKHRYEWKLKIGKNTYSIYDWLNEDKTHSTFEENEWYLGGDSENEINIKSFYQYMTKCIDEIESKKNIVVQDESRLEENEVQGESELEDIVNEIGEEIQLDIIDQDRYEINLDDIEF